MWTGAFRGFAGLKFSISPKAFGEIKIIERIVVVTITIEIESFVVNVGLNFILSELVCVPVGLEDPFSWRKIRWVITITAINKGIMKWREKNRLIVGWEIDGPPQIQFTKSVPIIGMADNIPVITVAPQNDICPHGRTYPKKAVAIVISMITVPEIQTVFLFRGELKYIPRAMWMNIKIKNRDAPFLCKLRETHPFILSCIIVIIFSKAVLELALYIIDKINPVKICRVNVIPRRNPIFHNDEMEVGEGSSINDVFIIFVRGAFDFKFIFILEWCRYGLIGS